MSCASATQSEDKFEFHIFQDDEAEEEEEEHSQDINLEKIMQMTEAQDQQQCLQNLKEDKILDKLLLVEDDDDDGNNNDDDHHKEYGNIMALANDVAAAETANLLLPEEHQANFVDFDEFNICLNNILNDEDVDVEAELSPSIVIGEAISSNEVVDQMFKVNESNTSPMPMLESSMYSNVNTSSSSSGSSIHSGGQLVGGNDLLNMVQFEHMEFCFETELNDSHTTATTAIDDNTATSKRLHYNHHDYLNEDNIDLLSRLETRNAVQPPATAVSASVTTTTTSANANDGDVDVDEVNDGTPTALNNVINRNSHSIVNIFQ